ncbi:MAG: hypothetical protein NZ534_04990 [Bacteroidia bacterium]|nr:hypothetical protein [Bacteroidia bacterium]
MTVQASEDDLRRAEQHQIRALDGGENAALHLFNAAQLTLKAGAADRAGPLYMPLLGNRLPAQWRSVALNNFATIKAERDRDTSAALAYLKKAILDDPDNEIARYNYELLKKKSPPPPPMPPDEPEPPPTTDDDNPNAVFENTGRAPKPKPLTPEQAQTAIADYRKREAQYLQQLRKRIAFNPYLNQSLW